jgi:hypothetical protein
MTLMREQVVRRIAEQRNQLSLLMQTIQNAKKTQLISSASSDQIINGTSAIR